MSRKLVLFEMDRVRSEVDKLFKNFLDMPRLMHGKRVDMKKPDVSENENELVVKMNMPGLKKQDIDLKISEHSVEVKAQQRHEAKIEKKGMMKEESDYKGFYTSFPLPGKVLADKSKALYKNGVLEIHMPESKGIDLKHIKKIEVK